MSDFYVETIRTYSVTRRWLVPSVTGQDEAETVAWEEDAKMSDRMTVLVPGDWITGEVRPAKRKDYVDRSVRRAGRAPRRAARPVAIVASQEDKEEASS